MSEYLCPSPELCGVKRSHERQEHCLTWQRENASRTEGSGALSGGLPPTASDDDLVTPSFRYRLGERRLSQGSEIRDPDNSFISSTSLVDDCYVECDQLVVDRQNIRLDMAAIGRGEEPKTSYGSGSVLRDSDIVASQASISQSFIDGATIDTKYFDREGNSHLMPTSIWDAYITPETQQFSQIVESGSDNLGNPVYTAYQVYPNNRGGIVVDKIRRSHDPDGSYEYSHSRNEWYSEPTEENGRMGNRTMPERVRQHVAETVRAHGAHMHRQHRDQINRWQGLSRVPGVRAQVDKSRLGDELMVRFAKGLQVRTAKGEIVVPIPEGKKVSRRRLKTIQEDIAKNYGVGTVGDLHVRPVKDVQITQSSEPFNDGHGMVNRIDHFGSYTTSDSGGGSVHDIAYQDDWWG